MSVVAVAWLAVLIAPPGRSGLLVGAAVAAYALPGAVGAMVFGRWLRRLPAERLLAADSWLRALLLGCVPLAWAVGVLHPVLYVVLLAGSSVLHAWGSAGKYSLLAQILPPDQRLAANALVSSSTSASVIVGPALAGFLATAVSPAWIVGLNAVSFAVLAIQVHRLGAVAKPIATSAPVDTGRSAAGLHLLRRQPELLGALALTWFFNFLYGPVEVALPLHVTEDLHAESSLLGLYWTLFGAGAVLGGLTAGALRKLPLWPVTLGIVAGWGVTLVPFGLGALKIRLCHVLCSGRHDLRTFHGAVLHPVPGPYASSLADHGPGGPKRRPSHGRTSGHCTRRPPHSRLRAGACTGRFGGMTIALAIVATGVRVWGKQRARSRLD